MPAPASGEIHWPYGNALEGYRFVYKIEGVVQNITDWDGHVTIRDSAASTSTQRLRLDVGDGCVIDGAAGTLVINADAAKMISGSLEEGRDYYFGVYIDDGVGKELTIAVGVFHSLNNPS